MVSPALLEQAQALSTEDKLVLIDALWQSVDGSATDVELAIALDGLKAYQEDPDAVRDYRVVMAGLLRHTAPVSSTSR